MRNWLSIKWDEFLVFLGLRLPDEWLLLQAIKKVTDHATAKQAFTVMVIIRLTYGTKCTKENIKRIIEYCED